MGPKRTLLLCSEYRARCTARVVVLLLLVTRYMRRAGPGCRTSHRAVQPHPRGREAGERNEGEGPEQPQRAQARSTPLPRHESQKVSHLP